MLVYMRQVLVLVLMAGVWDCVGLDECRRCSCCVNDVLENVIGSRLLISFFFLLFQVRGEEYGS